MGTGMKEEAALSLVAESFVSTAISTFKSF
jgi:hypothetical protein